MADDDQSFFSALEQEGVAPELLERIKNFTKASPLRHKAKNAEERAKELEEENMKLRKSVLGQSFKDAGIAADPSLFNLPPDLDFTSSEAVREWARKSNLISDQIDESTKQELEQIEQVEQLSTGSTTPRSGVITPAMVAEWPVDRMRHFASSNPVEWEQLKRGNEVTGVPVPN